MNNLDQTIRKIFSLTALLFLCFNYTDAQHKNLSESNTLPVSTPEAEDVSSAGILQFLEAVNNGNNELHSFMILRHGKLIAEGYWSPYGREFRHVMYSVSKSFTSIGVGLAIAEEKLKLNDKVVSFFSAISSGHSQHVYEGDDRPGSSQNVNRYEHGSAFWCPRSR
ncbi:MAG: serine hydrolase [Saprospiraceae bacterium]|nr:serine hydrolase [Saprospiraceae bacterium]